MADITFIGNVGRDAEIKFPKNGGQAFATFSVCDSKSRKNGDEWETLAEQWFNVTIFGPAAEALGAAIRKGDRVKVSGEMYERKYEKDGETRTALDVVAVGASIFPRRNKGGQAPGWADPQQGGGFGGQSSAGDNVRGAFPDARQEEPPADPWAGTTPAAFGDSNGDAPF